MQGLRNILKSNENKILLLSILTVLVLVIAPMGTASAEYAQNNTTGQQIVGQPTVKATDGKFRVGPTVRIRPLNDVINKSTDGIIEIYLENPNINDIPLSVDARISVPSGIHVYGQGFGLADAAGVVYGMFEVPPGTVRTIYVNIKAEKTGSYYAQFSGIYWPGDNKDAYQPISLTYPFTVYEPSPDPKSAKLTNPEQVPESARDSDFIDKIFLAIIIAVIAGGIGLVYKIYEIRYQHKLQTESKTIKTRTIEGKVTENETTETKTTEEKK